MAGRSFIIPKLEKIVARLSEHSRWQKEFLSTSMRRFVSKKAENAYGRFPRISG